MKSFVSDYYQVVPWENGGFEATLGSFRTTRITYNPDDKIKPWHKQIRGMFMDIHTFSRNITGLDLSKYDLELLHEVPETIGRQDLMDDEIVFVEDK